MIRRKKAHDSKGLADDGDGVGMAMDLCAICLENLEDGRPQIAPCRRRGWTGSDGLEVTETGPWEWPGNGQPGNGHLPCDNM